MKQENSSYKKEIIPIVVMAFLFIFIYSLSLLVVGPFESAGMEAFENPDDPVNLVIFFSVILVMTALILFITKFWKKKLIRFIILGAVGYTSFYVFFPLLSLLLVDWFSLICSIVLAFILMVVLYIFPEWYIIDICGVVIGTGAIAIFGISLDIPLVIILLVVLAIYDAVSVYKTKHMIDLADTVMDLKLPVLLVIPKVRKYSLIKETKRLKEKLEEGEERDAFFMGLGDVVMPGILVAAVYHNINDGLPIALSVMLGTLFGFVILMSFVIKGKPQAGLPCLCGGAIAGYIISSYVLFGSLIGFSIPI